MRSCTFSILASLCLAAFVLTGCQSSGLTMPKLAFWKQNDQLAAEDIEPPSHKLSPTRTGSDRVAHVDAGEGPPKRPEKKEVAPPSMDEFRAEVNRSWDQLAEKTRDATEEAARDVSAAAMDIANVETSPAVPNRGALAPAVSAPGSNAAAAESPSRPLFPSYDAVVAARGSGGVSGSPADSTTSGSGFRPSGGGFQPANSGGSSGFGGGTAMADSGNPSSSSSGGTFRPQTNYEKIANSQFGGSGSVFPPSSSPAPSNTIAASPVGDFQPASSPLAPAPQTTTPIGLQPRMGSADIAEGASSMQPSSQLPSMPPLNTTPQAVAGAGGTMAANGGFSANPGGTGPSQTPSQPQSNPASQYAETPYQPFSPTASAATPYENQVTSGVATHSGTNTASPISSSLNLTGLGNYAPGSVQRPTPTQTAQSPSSSNNGGSFKR